MSRDPVSLGPDNSAIRERFATVPRLVPTTKPYRVLPSEALSRCQFWCQFVLGFGTLGCAALRRVNPTEGASTQAIFSVLRFGAECCAGALDASTARCSTAELRSPLDKNHSMGLRAGKVVVVAAARKISRFCGRE